MSNLEAAIPHLFALASGLLVLLAQWFAGGARRLANVDYSHVADAAALNRWAAWRLLPIPLIAAANAACAWFGWDRPDIAWPAFAITTVACMLWLIVGSRRFVDPQARPR